MYDFNYFDMALTHTNDSCENTTCRMNALGHCGQQRLEIQLTDKRCVDNLSRYPELDTSPPPVTTSDTEILFISSWLHRRVVHTLGGGGGGHGLAQTTYVAHRPTPLSQLPCPASAKHGIGNWFDIRYVLHSSPSLMSQLPPSFVHLWIWAPAAKAPEVQKHFREMRSVGWVKGPWTWHLWTSDAAIRACDEIQIMRIRLSLQGEVGTVLPWPTLPEGPLVLRALTLQMQAALEDKNLGRWAELMQERTRYLPFSILPCAWHDGSVTSIGGSSP